MKVREWWTCRRSSHTGFIGAVVVEVVVVGKIGVWRVTGELVLLPTNNLYVPAAEEGGKLGVAVLDINAVKLHTGAARWLR